MANKAVPLILVVSSWTCLSISGPFIKSACFLNFSTNFSTKKARGRMSILHLWICRHSGHDHCSLSPLTSIKHLSQKLCPHWVYLIGAWSSSENFDKRIDSNFRMIFSYLNKSSTWDLQNRTSGLQKRVFFDFCCWHSSVRK